MAVLKTPDTLEIGSIIGTNSGALYFRAFEVFRDDAIMSRTYIARWVNHTVELLGVFDFEVCDVQLDDLDKLHILGSNGQYSIYDDNAWHELFTGFEPSYRVSALRLIDSKAYALGTYGMLFEWNIEGWEAISLGLEGSALRDLVSLEDNSLVFCGTNGAFGFLQDGSVDLVELPTSAHYSDTKTRNYLNLSSRLLMLISTALENIRQNSLSALRRASWN